MSPRNQPIFPEEQLLLQSLRCLSIEDRNFICRAIDAMAQHPATPSNTRTAPEGGNPQSLTTTKGEAPCRTN